MSIKTINSVKIEFDTYKELVKYVLEIAPETRDNDTYLYLACCGALGAEDMDDMYNLNLSIITVHKIRQKIQNDEGLYKPSTGVQAMRYERDDAVKDYMNNN